MALVESLPNFDLGFSPAIGEPNRALPQYRETGRSNEFNRPKDGELEMARQPVPAREGISPDTKWVVGAVGAVGLILMGGLATWIKVTADDAHKVQVEMTREFGVMRTDLVKAIGEVEKGVAVTNSKLDGTNSRLDNIVAKLPPQFR